MSELLFEIGCEEIPSRLIARADRQLGQLLAKGLDDASLAHEGLTTYSTPRRLAVVVEVADRQPDVTRDMLGPPARVAFDADGNPTRAAEAFAKRHGVALDALERRDTPRGEYLGVTLEIEGRATAELLPSILVTCVSKIEWPKGMRWGACRDSWIRPIHWYVALLGGEVVPMSWVGIDSGRTTRGHRFHAPEPFEVASAAEWLVGLRSRQVEPDSGVRRAAIADAVEGLSREVGAIVDVPGALLDEVTGLVEHVVPMRGTFEEAYLALPAQVLTTSMKKHQRYFPVWKAEGELSNHFVVIAGTDPADADVVVNGHARVLRARLSDARFFYEQDRSRALETFVPRLAGRRFLEGLGSMKDKAERLERLATSLAGVLAAGDEGLAAAAARAGLLAKADLATSMVGEFGNLQGEMGRDYARLAGEGDAVAEAIFEHYLPRFAGDGLPATLAGTCVALADKLDSLVGCFALGLEPTGSADPFALRRQALGVVRLLEAADGAPTLGAALDLGRAAYGDTLDIDWPTVRERLLGFFRSRMKAALAGEFPSDLTEAVLAVGFDQPADARGRLTALHALKQTDGWDDLAVAVKRVAKIVGDHEPGALDPASLTEPAEQALFEACQAVERGAADALAAGNYTEALGRMVTLRPTIDGFFDAVMVMSEDPGERARRLALLGRIDALFHRVAAFANVST